MARMNWDRVRSEGSIARYGWHRAAETYGPSKARKTKKKKSRTLSRRNTANKPISKEQVVHQALIAKQKEEAHQALIAKQKELKAKRRQQRQLVHEALVQKQKEEKAKRRLKRQLAHQALFKNKKKRRSGERKQKVSSVKSTQHGA